MNHSLAVEQMTRLMTLFLLDLLFVADHFKCKKFSNEGQKLTAGNFFHSTQQLKHD